MEYNKKFTISGWSCRAWSSYGLNRSPAEVVKEWHDLGLTLMIAYSDSKDWSRTHALLDEAHKHGMKLIIQDWGANVDNLIVNGEEHYRESMKKLVDEFGSHPATFGFYVTDEPHVDNLEDTLKACRINNELAPHLTAYMNLLPWFDWIAERMGTKEYAPYLDKVVKEGELKLLSYDCYTQMYANKVGYNDYFNNLREQSLASKRNNVPFYNIVLCTGHYDYMCPTKDDLLWQLNTSVAHGAKGVSWFIIDTPDEHNYRNAPINLLGERTSEYYTLGEVNRTFNEYHGRVFAALTLDECYHVCESYGGMPLFEPFGCVLNVESRGNVPLIASGYHNDEGERFFAICNNTTDTTTCVSLTIKEGTEILKCRCGNTFGRPDSLTDPVGERENKVGNTKTYTFFLSAGQLMLFKEEKEK
ncbi:MAG: hypothetical protein IJV87_00140 [Clostridia bacterium]|nr:hypothetical protein [Clostridia bacterium]